MITAGEQTGEIDNMLERVADFLDEEIETTLSGLTSLIEPILIVFLGVVIGGMVICMFLPIFKMSEIVNPSNRLTRRRRSCRAPSGAAPEGARCFVSLLPRPLALCWMLSFLEERFWTQETESLCH
jgi:hypothetical protein